MTARLRVGWDKLASRTWKSLIHSRACHPLRMLVMNLLQLSRITLAELFTLVTFVAVSCVALLNASDTTAWIVGGLFWLALLFAIAGAVTPGLRRRPFLLGFLAAALLHLYLMQYTAGRGQSTYDLDMPTFYLIEVLWGAIPADHWGPDAPPTEIIVRNRRMMMQSVSAASIAHANFQGIATQLFSIFYGMLAGFLAQSFARQVEQRRPPPAA